MWHLPQDDRGYHTNARTVTAAYFDTLTAADGYSHAQPFTDTSAYYYDDALAGTNSHTHGNSVRPSKNSGGALARRLSAVPQGWHRWSAEMARQSRYLH